MSLFNGYMNEKKQIRNLFGGRKRSIQFTNRDGKRYVKIGILGGGSYYESFATIGNRLRSLIPNVRMTSANMVSATFRLPAFPYRLILSSSPSEEWQINVDEQICSVHPAEVCKHPCVLHAPTNHHMRDWTLHWRSDRGCFERLCPEHGVGHPDPDDKGHDGIHGCCGCCVEDRETLRYDDPNEEAAVTFDEIEIGVND